MNLEKLCKRADPKEIVSRPFGIVFRDVNYAVATNGWALAAVSCDQIPEPLEKVPDLMLKVLDKKFDGKEIDLDELAAFCGPPFFMADCRKCAGTGKVKCPECHGEGEYEHTCGYVHDCAECDGEGKTNCRCENDKISDAFILDKPFNAHLVAQALAASGASGKAMAGIADDTMLCIDGEGFMLRIEGLRRPDPNARRFE